MIDLPPSFFIVSMAVLAWVVVLVITGARRSRRTVAEPLRTPITTTPTARRAGLSCANVSEFSASAARITPLGQFLARRARGRLCIWRTRRATAG